MDQSQGEGHLYSQAVDKQNEQQDVVNFGRAIGPRISALEHLVPEQLFSTEENPAEGISAVKVIALAQAEGQRVYTITQGNLNAALTALNASTAIENEIRNAVYVGKEVTIHQSSINHYGWNGHGYIIFDPETGAGAYKIGGGADGGFGKNLKFQYSKGMLWLSMLEAQFGWLTKLDIGLFFISIIELGVELCEVVAKCSNSINAFVVATIFLMMAIATLWITFMTMGLGFIAGLIVSTIVNELRAYMSDYLVRELC